MAISTRYRVRITWLLSALFILPLAARTLHIALEERHRDGSEDSHEQHDCTSCSVCQFAFTALVDTAPPADDLSVIPADRSPVLLSCEAPRRLPFISCGLRAPPVM